MKVFTRSKLIITSLLAALYISPFATFANMELERQSTSIGGRKILTVVIEEVGYFPFNYTENGEIKGFSIDVLEYFEKHSKYDFEYIILPWPRALFLVNEGDVDLVLTLFKSFGREQVYHFIEPSYGFEVNQLFTLKENPIEFTGQLQQLTPYSIGTVREYSYGKSFDQADYLNKLPALTEQVLLKLLLGKRIDMLIGNPLAFDDMIMRENVEDEVKAIEPYVAMTPVHMALTRKRPDALEIKKILGKLTQQLKNSEQYQRLLQKYKLDFKGNKNNITNNKGKVKY